MIFLLSAVVAATTVKAVGVVISVLVGIGAVAYVLINLRQGRSEVGAEIELAANRKPYYDDEQLEGPRLNRALFSGLVLMAVTAVGLPMYWLNEPGRQDGARQTFDDVFVKRGSRLFATTAEGGYNCAGCHGAEGVGGQAPFTLTESDGKFVANVTWRAPALNTVLLRFSEEELRQILVYGRPGTPMPAWGEEGGGPLTTQQIDELIAYIESIQISSEDAKAEVAEALARELELVTEDDLEGLDADEQQAAIDDAIEEIDWNAPATGEALFNLGIEDGFAGGAYSCARCHTQGAAFEHGTIEPAGADLSAFAGFEDGSGAFGFSLTSGVIPRQFLTIEDLIEFLTEGSEFGVLYGRRGQGSGRMPGFGDNPDDDADDTDDETGDGMFTYDMLCAVAKYEASLGDDETTISKGCSRLEAESTSTTSTTEPATGGGTADEEAEE
jgi:mono/diheme cytochrome c family protein